MPTYGELELASWTVEPAWLHQRTSGRADNGHPPFPAVEVDQLRSERDSAIQVRDQKWAEAKALRQAAPPSCTCSPPVDRPEPGLHDPRCPVYVEWDARCQVAAAFSNPRGGAGP